MSDRVTKRKLKRPSLSSLANDHHKGRDSKSVALVRCVSWIVLEVDKSKQVVFRLVSDRVLRSAGDLGMERGRNAGVGRDR